MSGDTASARMRTLCGCTRYITVPLPPPMEWLLPIQAVTPYATNLDNAEPVVIRVRKFRLVSRLRTEGGVEAEYEEVLETLADLLNGTT